MWAIRLFKFLFLVVFLTVVMVFSVVYPVKGYTLYQRGFHLVTGEYPDIDQVTETDQNNLDQLIQKTARGHRGG